VFLLLQQRINNLSSNIYSALADQIELIMKMVELLPVPPATTTWTIFKE
jgi:hypothetical protein